MPGVENVPPKDEMTSTAINLLLAILEGTIVLLCRISNLVLTHLQQTLIYPSKTLQHWTKYLRQ